MDYACALTIHYDDTRICSSNVREMAQRAQGMCSCAAKLVDLWSGKDGTLLKQDSPDKATSAALRKAAELSVCVVESGFGVNSNKDAALQKIVNDDSNAYIVFPELDTTMYVDLIDRLALCGVSGQCQSLITFFTDYMQQAGKILTHTMVVPVHILTHSLTLVGRESVQGWLGVGCLDLDGSSHRVAELDGPVGGQSQGPDYRWH